MLFYPQNECRVATIRSSLVVLQTFGTASPRLSVTESPKGLSSAGSRPLPVPVLAMPVLVMHVSMPANAYPITTVEVNPGRDHLERPTLRRRSKPTRPVACTIKRSLDILIAGSALLIAAPVVLMIAAVVKLTMGGPVIFGHQRIGLHGRRFYCLKFRSMVSNGDEVLRQYLDANPIAQDEWRQKQKLAYDPRITRFGRVLRRSSLDELPQFYNILRGDMSCVGPRPIVEGELARYGEYATDYTSVRPGLTGLWQVSGRSRVSYETRIQLDVDYIENWTLGCDISILLRTIPAVMKPDDAG